MGALLMCALHRIEIFSLTEFEELHDFPTRIGILNRAEDPLSPHFED